MAAHDVGAVVPVKRLGYALGRLSGVLDRAGRRVLQSAMLGDVLAALAGSARLGEIVVVTSDPRARAVAESVGARTVPDHDPPQGINAAVAMGIAALDARSALVVVSDLPLITAADVDHLVGAGHREAVTWVPLADEARRGFLQSAGWGPDTAYRDREVADGVVREVRLVTIIADEALG